LRFWLEGKTIFNIIPFQIGRKFRGIMIFCDKVVVADWNGETPIKINQIEPNAPPQLRQVV